jgi:hypothetical protein
MNDFGALNPRTGCVSPTFKIAGGDVGSAPVPLGGMTCPSVHELGWLNHQVRFARNSALSAFAELAAIHSAADVNTAANKIGAIVRMPGFAIVSLPPRPGRSSVAAAALIHSARHG